MQEFLTQAIQIHPLVGPLVFILFRALAIIIPPIPGIIFDAISMASFGWIFGAIYAVIGIVSGAMITFWIGRYFRKPLISKFIAISKLNKWEEQLTDTKEFWSLVILRFVANPLFDYIGYISGLTNISWVKFFITTLIGTTPQVVLIYYFGFLTFNNGIVVGLSILSVAVVILYFTLPYIKKKIGIKED